jgi:HK97 gp10 family phage protein
MELKINFTGWEELEGQFNQLEEKLRKKIGIKATNAGGKILLDSAKSLVPVKSGKLRDSLKVKRKINKDGFTKVLVGTSVKWFVGDDFYGAFQEYGWKQGPRRLGSKRKKIAGEHFVEYTYNSKATQAAQATVDTIMFEVFKIMDKK